MVIPPELRDILARAARGEALSSDEMECRDRCMDERWKSVEGMLRWMIAEKHVQRINTERSLMAAGDLYPLPKPGDGLPKCWAFGSMTGADLDLKSALDGLRSMEHWLGKAESAVDSSDFPQAIHLLDMATASWQSVLAGWSGGGATRMYRFVQKRRAANARPGNRKKPTAEAVEMFRAEYINEYRREWGWMKAAARHFDVSIPTIREARKKMSK